MAPEQLIGTNHISLHNKLKQDIIAFSIRDATQQKCSVHGNQLACGKKSLLDRLQELQQQ